jgi:Na+/proline symporter
MLDSNLFQIAWSNISKNLAPIDYLIVLGYLLVTMLIGLKVGGHISGIKDYAVGGRSFIVWGRNLRMPVLLATLLATMVGAEDTLGDAESGFIAGLVWPVCLYIIPILVMYFFIGYFIAPRMYKYIKKDTITMGDLMGDFYGPFGKTTVSISGVLLYIGFVAVQLYAIGVFTNDITGIDKSICIILCGGFIVGYCAIGGIKAVTFTDVFQFLVLLIAIPLVCSQIVSQSGGLLHVIHSVPETHLKFWLRDDFYQSLLLAGVLCIPGYEIGPAIVQRFLMTDDHRDISRAFYICALLTVPFALVILLVSFSAVAVNMPVENAEFTMSYMIKSYTPPLIKGIAIAGFLAIVMSSVDSMLNAGGILFAHDLAAPLAKKYDIKNFDELNWARGSTVGIGVLSILVALVSEHMVHIALNTLLIWSPIISIPFLAYVLGMRPKIDTFKINTYAVLIVGGALLLTTQMEDFEVRLVSMLLTNILVFFTAHHILGPAVDKKRKDVKREKVGG